MNAMGPFRMFSLLAVICLAAALLPGEASAQRGPGGRFGGGPGGRFGGGPPGQDPQFAADRDDFHYLLSHHDQIRREVKNLDNGVETLTESDDAEVAKRIQQHVKAMYQRVEKSQPIHLRDPLFAAVFGNADKIAMKMEPTEKGVRVIETSDDPYTALLIQAHAKVVSLFVANGFNEVHKNHDVPPRPEKAAD